LYSITNQKNWFALMVLVLVCTSASHVRKKKAIKYEPKYI